MYKCRYIDPPKGLENKLSSIIECDVKEQYTSLRRLYELVKTLSTTILGLPDAKPTFTGNEPIGTRYQIYRFRIQLNEKYISIRVIIRGDQIIKTIITIPKTIEIKTNIGKPYRYTKIYYEPAPEPEEAPGQYYIVAPVIYRILGQPTIDVENYRLVIDGEVLEPRTYSLEELRFFPQITIEEPFHCVTGWSVAKIRWTGVPLRRLLEASRPRIDTGWLYIESYDGYTTVIPLTDANAPNAILALKMNDEPLPPEHGYPARLIVPSLYGYKSAKWVKRLYITREYRDGYWEALGYHERGSVLFEERFKS